MYSVDVCTCLKLIIYVGIITNVITISIVRKLLYILRLLYTNYESCILQYTGIIILENIYVDVK